MWKVERLAAVAVAAACLSCGSASAGRVDAAESRLAQNERAYQVNARDVASLKELARELGWRVDAARRDFVESERLYQEAVVQSHRAAILAEEAAKHHQAAAKRYRLVTTIIILAAASDLFMRGACGPRVSTASYRRRLQAQGVELKGMDIDHLFARSRGGPDRPWNYLPLEASINRSLGAGGLGWKLMNYPLATLEALAKTASYHLVC